MKIIIMLGLPGAGKTTQSLLIRERYNLCHISTGDMIREEIENKSPLGLKYKNLIAGGEFVSDDVIMEFIENRLASENAVKGFVFDGFPRTLPQAQLFEALLKKTKPGSVYVFLLSVTEEEAIGRLLQRGKCSGRKDDNEAAIKNRMEIYKERTQDAVDHYMSKNRVIIINGMKDVAEVFDELAQRISVHGG